MQDPVFSVRAFGVYLWLLGTTLLLAPNLLLTAFGLPATDEVWIRVVGVLVINIGVYYFTGARKENPGFLRATAYARGFVLAAFIAFVALGYAPAMLIGFGAVDALGGAWTLWALRAGARG